ncbi:MAG: sugar transferase [Chloroflexi bacterium]|nr:MAG: sugar transferase [Chloroflexota bacterium]
MKRALDLAVAVPLLVILSPVLVALAAAVRLTSRGPAFHRATRVGRDGRPFTMLKLRTMRAGPGAAITTRDDPRMTTLGRALRRARLDELPQLFNVVRGEMSIVGPRPEDPRFVALYSEEQRAVLALRPGITGAAQLVFRDEAALLDPADPEGSYVRAVLPRKLAIDLEYARGRSLAGDLRIMGMTLRGLPKRGR